MEKVKLRAIKSNSIINIQVSAGFYSRVQKLLFWLSARDQEKALKTLEALKTREPEDEFEFNFLTLMTLIFEIETKADQQGLMEDVEHEYEAKA